ncbi:hypothetical protein QJS10_CPA01g02440 [Acorus calamus]|uniref:Uncharacterized protein n=1 Tax=Acorus calamus TaxID=4465 RepID=A0AAV9FGJ4_ACOCL|nr:hypothetical protein QJS10_CPA01g02440 [Acorus calamus]
MEANFSESRIGITAHSPVAVFPSSFLSMVPVLLIFVAKDDILKHNRSSYVRVKRNRTTYFVQCDPTETTWTSSKNCIH